jgi:DUF1680 family protein
MTGTIPRREFLKTTTAAAGSAYAAVVQARTQPGTQRTGEVVRIGSARYVTGDYSIRALPPTKIELRDDFWKPKLVTNATLTIPLLAARNDGRGLNGNVLEAAILSLQTHPDPKLQALVEARVATLTSQPSRGNRGFEVAAAWFRATGRRDLLDQAIDAAAALYTEFETNNPPFSGGERDAINCLQLYRVTKNRRHLDLAKHYLDIRGLPNSVNRSRHNQSYRPVLEQTEAVGHAVNCVTLMLSMLEVGVLTGTRAYVTAARRMWEDIVNRKMYVTGGIGSTGNEGFGEPYVLPNISAYAETCAVLMFATLNHRLFLLTGDSRYIDVLERGIYNNALSGVSPSGDRFFYVNRLASAGDGRDTRWERASLECCPPNLVRFLASMPGYIYAQDDRGAVYVNLYVSSHANFSIGSQTLRLQVESGMPWTGRTAILASASEPVRAAVKLRIPGWARNRVAPGTLYSYSPPRRGSDGAKAGTAVSINGRRVSGVPDAHGYLSLDREWRTGDRIELEFPFEPTKVTADDRVRETRGRVAIERGPIVYCLEGPDVDNRRALDLRIESESELSVTGATELAPTTLSVAAKSVSNPSEESRAVTLIPYYLWANRGPAEMSVWIPTRDYIAGDTGPAGGLIFYVNPNYAADGWRYLEAAPFDQSLGTKWGCFRREIQGARGTAIGTGRQNTQDMLAACTERGTAADLCAAYVLNGIGGWFLPSLDELTAMYTNLRATGGGDFRDEGMADNCQYWTSSQQTADMANHIDFADNGRVHYDDKDFPRRVRAIRAF